MRDLTLAVVCATVALLSRDVAAYAACGDGIVDIGEQCDRGATPSACCSAACTFEASTVVCRPATEPCDLAETCSGTSDECPADVGPSDQDGDGVCDAIDICPFVANPAQDDLDVCLPKPYKKLTAAQLARFEDGFDEFHEFKSIQNGLGPVFNGASCAECHDQPVIGGFSELFVTRFGRYESGTFDPMSDSGGSLVQAKGIDDGACAVAGETVPPEATVSTHRITTPLFGAGLLEAIPQEAILSYADPTDADGNGISGRANVVGGLLGRFGWKAQVATLRDFAGDALLNEMGITNPDFPDESNPQGGPVVCDTVADPEDDATNVDAITDFMTMLAPLKPTRTPGSGRGRRLFRSIECDSCHVSMLRTGDNAMRALHRQRARLFSDLLLHDMGAALADGIEQGQASGSEFRTAPLWGAGRRGPFLHDGRATTLLDAVLAHGGEAQAARNRFAALADGDRGAIIAFLASL